MNWRSIDAAAYDPKDPNPWLALQLDQSLPIDESAKGALLRGAASWSRHWLFNIARPFFFVFLLIAKIFRGVSPSFPNMNTSLHRLIYWGLKTFASPDCNYLILRHFHIGTEILAFIKTNAGAPDVETVPLRPRTLKDLEDNVFLQHDLNIFNFIIQLNLSLKKQGRELEPPEKLDFSMISDGPFDIEPTKKGLLNIIDVQTAVEAYTPLYALLLPRNDFIRASNSLQLDETIAIYLARLLGTDYHLAFIKNGHPMVPLTTLQAGYRLMMHGLDCEGLHGWLREMKRRGASTPQAAALVR
ncbi:MAG: hypothetical protein JNJ63_02575 [Hyphomonadaceae bacterium]|nr:hypothetical protein [Hyphomonadaceae bacterium]